MKSKRERVASITSKPVPLCHRPRNTKELAEKQEENEEEEEDGWMNGWMDGLGGGRG